MSAVRATSNDEVREELCCDARYPNVEDGAPEMWTELDVLIVNSSYPILLGRRAPDGAPVTIRTARSRPARRVPKPTVPGGALRYPTRLRAGFATSNSPRSCGSGTRCSSGVLCSA